MKSPTRSDPKALLRGSSSVFVTFVRIVIFIFIFNAFSNVGECVIVETSSSRATTSSSSSSSIPEQVSTTSSAQLMKNRTNTEVKADLLRKAFKRILKLKSLPNVGHGKSKMSSPPQYMLELYEKYRRGDIPKSNAIRGNTVRSILSIKGKLDGDQTLLFNLSGIHSQEEILLGELHFYKRRKVKWHDKSKAIEYKMKFFGVRITTTEVIVVPMDTITIPRNARGWQVHNLTKILRDCRKAETHLLGITIQGLNTKSKFVNIPLNKFIKMNSQPFLIVFSNDKENNTIEEIETQMTETFLNGGDQKNPLMSDKTTFKTDANEINPTSKGNQYFIKYSDEGKNIGFNLLKRFSRSSNNKSQTDGENFSQQIVKRSIYDNELPEDTMLSNFIPQTSPNVLQSRNRQKQKSTQVIPYPHTMTFGKYRKKENHSKKGRKKQHRRLPKAWQSQEASQQPNHENDATAHGTGQETNNLCRKRKLLVDFADIGWGEWIISPKSFEAHYCVGACPFPLTKNMKPSNHATIQSIVHAIGMHPNVPAPCCVADVMSSVTLLYFDEDRNVVLKNYPSMTVESCACR